MKKPKEKDFDCDYCTEDNLTCEECLEKEKEEDD